VSSARVAAHSTTIRARHYSAPFDSPPQPGHRVTAVELDAMEGEAGKPVRATLCEALRSDHVALVGVSEEQGECLDRMWAECAEFFAKTAEERAESAGALREAYPSKHHASQSRAYGYAEVKTDAGSSNSFLDTRLRLKQNLQLELQPVMDAPPTDFASAAAASQQVLLDVGFAALSAAAESLGMKVSEVAPLVDFPERLAPGATCATVHRFAHYGGDMGVDPVDAESSVTFQAHTDGTWFTVIPCAAVPGLEVFASAEHGWVSPERDAAATGRMVMVLTGEFLQLLSDGEYTAALHRVVRPLGDAPRLSAPLLMRGSAASGFSGVARDGTLVARILKSDEEVAVASPPNGAGGAPQKAPTDAKALMLRRIAEARAYKVEQELNKSGESRTQ